MNEYYATAATGFGAGSVGRQLHLMMTENGLWPEEADAVLEMARTEKQTDQLGEILYKQWSAYPKVFQAVAWMTVKSLAVKYIDANCPNHFARSLFL